MKKRKTSLLLAGLGMLVALSACQDNDSTAKTPATTQSSLQNYLLAEKPTEPQPVASFFGTAPGTEVTLSGKVMGSVKPLIDNRAMLVLGDPAKITSCNLMPDDHCNTPWDVCCDSKEDIKTSIATIQILDDNGAPLREGLRGLGGIQELTHLTVTGTVAEGSNAENLVINATGIHVGETDEFMTKVD